MRDDFQPGATLGRYEIIKKLAVGGMAQIYLARVRATAGFEKLVVLKRISPLVAEDREFVQMFLDEARLAATLRHPNIADVFDVGEDAGSYYFAMEFIHGQDARSVRLAAKEHGRAIPLEIALAVISGTAYALAYAHAKEGPTGPLGLVHRDISPSNILVSYDGAVKLVDFGIARVGNRISQKTRTRTGVLKGKVPYMSPEQCHGQPLDRRCDIFSLGTVFYELTCGVRPFDGHSEYDTLEMIARGRLQRPAVHVASYPPALESILLRMLAHEPADRYQTADDALADLERFTSDHGLLVSERVVAKYMRELFADEIAASEPRAPSLGPPAQPEELQPLLEMPELQVFIKRPGSSPPVEPPRRPAAPTRPPHWPRVPMPDRTRPVRPRAATFQDESPTLRPADFDDENPTEQSSRATAARSLAHLVVKHPVMDTLRDGELMVDPVMARAHEILDDVDREAPDHETLEDRALRRIDELAARATAWLAIGELESAVIAAELAFQEEVAGPRAQRALDAELPTFQAAFEGYLGDLERTAILARAFDELLALDLDPWMRHLLTRIAHDHEGVLVSGLLEDPVLDRVSVARWLCRLALRKMIVLA